MAVLKIGQTLQNGKYTITRVLGSGTFGISYLATTSLSVNGQLGQMNVTVNVAIKEFYMKDLNNRTTDGATVEGTQNTLVKDYRHKFRKEAENLSKLRHENIVKVIDVFDENNTTYYVMEYIDGGTLDDYILGKGRLPETEALSYAAAVGEALKYMHSCRMVHLDLKPKNIMRDKKGHIYLIDFGLSKQFDKNGEPESSTSIGLGTPGYAPLEQTSYKKDGTVPATLDIYALGATLFKMLTGTTPPDSSAILNDGFPACRLQQAGVSATVTGIVEKAMSPTRKLRYQSMDEFLRAIASVTGNKKEEDADTIIAEEDTDIKVRNSANGNEKAESVSATHEESGADDSTPIKAGHKTGIAVTALLAVVVCFALFFFIGRGKSDKKQSESTQAETEISFSKEIDLGLPSGTIWAGWNIGASKAEDPGGLFAWGETTPKKIFKTYFDSSYTKYTLAKGTTAIIGSEDDAAKVIWGGNWRMPTRKQFEELLKNCKWTQTTFKGCKGLMGKGPNGNMIFLPATGYGNENGIWYRTGSMAEGDYTCGELCSPKNHDHSTYDPVVDDDARKSMRAYDFSFRYNEQCPSLGCGPRKLGRAIRAVKQ